MNRPLTISFAGCCGVMLIGCRSAGIPPAVAALPPTSAPEISLRLASSSKVVGFAVTIDDQRPDFERQYYPGTCEPRRWRDAMSFVPMESFVPSIEEQLRHRVAAAVKSISPGTDRATMTLTSFQFAFDQREDIQGEYQAKYVNWAAVKEREDDERQARRDERQSSRDAQGDDRLIDPPDKNETLGDAVFGEIIGEIIGAMFTSLFIDMPRSKWRAHETRKRTLVEAQTLPTEITDSKQTGLNCQIHATVIFAGRQGAEVQRIIHINRHAPLTANGSLKDQIAAFIEAALEEFSSSI